MAELTDKHTIFVNDAYEFAPHAAKEIELRTSYYSSGLYGGAIPSVAYKWLYQKTAWAIIRSLEQVVTTSSDIKKEIESLEFGEKGEKGITELLKELLG